MRRGRCSPKPIADDVGAVGAYIAPVELKDSGEIKPGNLREHIRSKGLTIDLRFRPKADPSCTHMTNSIAR